jgi:hypothetical protein
MLLVLSLPMPNRFYSESLREFLVLAESLSASQEGLCCMVLSLIQKAWKVVGSSNESFLLLLLLLPHGA